MPSARTLRRQARTLPAAIQVGKAGLTPGVIAEVKAWLKREGILKVRLSKAYLAGRDRKEAARAVAEAAGAELIQQVGFIAVLARKKTPA
jgi:RNA-binding protein YhbY